MSAPARVRWPAAALATAALVATVGFTTMQRRGLDAGALLRSVGSPLAAALAAATDAAGEDCGDECYGQPVARRLAPASSSAARDVYSEEPDCMSCTTCRGVPGPSVCPDGVPDSSVPDPASAWDPAAARAWFDGLQCPFPRSMWIVSTLTPGHPREAYIVDRMRTLTSHSAWAVLFVSTQQAEVDAGGKPAPIISVLGRNIGVMNLSLATLRSLPLESAKALLRLLKDRARGEWGRPDGLDDPMITAQGRLHMALKMIPYLVAIKCNARAIFDTVDDELPSYLPGLLKVNPDQVSGPFAPKEREYYALPPDLPEPPLLDIPTWPVLMTPRADVAPVVNPYASLGNRVIHPRGFPTELVYNASFQVLHVQRQMEPTRPLIQQWVPHGSPDLSYTDQANLRTHVLPKLMNEAPNVVLDQWAWAPYNARGTLFLPDAYWAMFLSPSQPQFFTDTLRAYWSLRLLWDVGGTVAYRTTTSPAPNPEFCGSDFGFHQERLDGGCEGKMLLRDAVLGPRKLRRHLLAQELGFQTFARPMVDYLDAWTFTEPGAGDAPQLAGLPPLFVRAATLMCNLGESSQLANCKDCFALRSWLRDLVAAGYTPPAPGQGKRRGPDVFPLQFPDRSVLSFSGEFGFKHNLDTLYEAPKPSDRQLSLAVCVSGLADRIDTRLEPEDYSLPPYKRAKIREDLMLDWNMRQMAPAFGGMSKIHHFYLMGSFNTFETNLHLLLANKLPFVAVAVHRDWILEPLLPPDEQCRMERYNGTWVQLKWTNEARYYQRSQLHQVWEESKCFELASRWMHKYNLRYTSFMRHRSDFNVTQFPGENAHYIPEWTADPAWANTVYIPRGKDWRGINDRIALGGWRGMSEYFFRWYGLRAKLWETGWDDYNHLWAEPFLNFTLREAGLNVIRLPQVLNYTEFDEIPKPRTYIGDDATRRRRLADGGEAPGRDGVLAPPLSQPPVEAAARASAAAGDAAAARARALEAELAATGAQVTALKAQLRSLTARLALSADVLEEPLYDEATGQRLPYMS